MLTVRSDAETAARKLLAGTAVDVAQAVAVAEAACGLFLRQAAVSDLAALLRDWDGDIDGLVAELDEMLGLPELKQEAPSSGVVAYRGERAIARLAAAVGGPTWLLEVPPDWTLVAPTETAPGGAWPVAAGLSGAARRKAPVLLLWRDGHASGWVLWRRGRPIAAWSWDTRWQTVAHDSIGDQREAARLLVRTCGGRVDQVAVRALLRRDPHDQDPLADLSALLGLPAALLDPLADLDGFAARDDVTFVPRGAARAVMAQAREGLGPDAPAVLRTVSTAYAIGTVLAALACVLMTAFGIAVLATNGAFVDQDGTNSDDWTTLAIFAVGSAVLIPTAVFRLRRVRKRRQSGAAPKHDGR